MLEIRNTEIVGLERSLKAAGNPMSIGDINTRPEEEDLGPTTKDLERGERLGPATQGSGHDNFLSGIDVYYDVKYSLYWSPEFQRYHFNQIISSQSKMHRLTQMGMSADFDKMFNKYVWKSSITPIKNAIRNYNKLVEDGWEVNFLKEEDYNKVLYEIFMQIISNLPAGFEQWMTIKTNYLQLKTMFNQRKHHKLQEDWGAFCDWCLTLPYFSQLTDCSYSKLEKTIKKNHE